MLAPPAAEAPLPYRTVVESAPADEPNEAQRDLDARTPGFATAVDLEDEPGSRPGDSLPEVIARTPGATVRSFGGLGQFGAVSLRGSSPQQVATFVDGVPLTSSVAGLVDLGSIPLDGLGRVEIYRGYVPVAFGGAAIGGAIDLKASPAWRRPRLSLHAGFGSFGTRESRVSLRGPLGSEERSAGALTVGYAGSTGGFPFIDDGGTPDLGGDDGTRRRTNNDYDRVAVHGRFDHRKDSWRFAVQQLVQYKAQGVPGPATAQTRDARLGTLVGRSVFSARHHGTGGPGGRLEWLTGLGLLHQIHRDPLGELGVGTDDQRVLGIDLYLSPRLRLPLWRGAYLGLVGDHRTEHVDVDQRALTAGVSGDAGRTRLSFGTGVELDQFLFDGRLRLVPAFRVDALDSRFAAPTGEGEQEDTGRDVKNFGIAPRVGARVRLWPGIELRGSGGQYFRPPTLAELFGNRGYIIGEEGLRPERGQAIDGGLVVDRSIAGLGVYAAVAGFATWSEDLIQWVSAGAVVRPVNVRGARLRGVESALALVPRRRLLTLHLNYTFLDTRNDADDPAQRGEPLPGRPRHELFARATAGKGGFLGRVWTEPRLLYTVDVVTGTALDSAGRLTLPARVVQGMGAELSLGRRVHLTFEVRNLLDVRTTTVVIRDVDGARPRSTAFQDFLGYPLPGRSLWSSVRIDFGGTTS
ncbi:MAG: TonB-dependent receptor [Myxococcota bacterium]